MNIDGTLVSELFDNNKVNTKNASVRVNSVEFTNSTEAFFGKESVIKSADNTGDAYDRIVPKVNTDNTGEMAITPESINKIADVVTPENYSKYEELGIEPDKDDPSSILTVSERIEIELATHCENYKPIGDINMADLEEVYGDRAGEIKETLDKLSSLEPISKEASEYLLTNDMNLSIDNVYKAEYSTSGAKSEKYQELTDEEWQELKPQIEKMLDESGLKINDKNVDNAKWLVEEKIPVTSENLYKLNQIDKINSNMQTEISNGEWLTNIVSDMSFGLAAGSTSADYYSTISADSAEAVEIINNGTPEQITTLVTDGKEVTLLNMKRAEEDTAYTANQERKEENNKEITDDIKKKIITGRKNLEELRLKMTVEASATMIKNGINIEITSLSELVEELKGLENKYVESVFNATGNVAADEEISAFSKTTDYMEKFADTPSYVLGNVLNNDIEFKVEDMTMEGVVKESIFKSAEMAYDTLGTKPDRELGDSLKKAFSGIDDMLENMELEDTVENERAVRILAYNELEITKENVSAINEMDTQVTRLIENLTPRTTAYLIANGINPLKTNINELNDELDKINEEIGTDEVEKYSEFLWKLDKNKQISEEDREAYVGIYRLIRMVEKGDRRAVGAVAKQGNDLTMKNLLTAARSIKNSGMEVTVDDELGTSETVKLSDSNIDKQLDRFDSDSFAKRAARLVNTAVEAVNDMENGEADTTEELNYNELKVSEIQNLKVISEETLRSIYEDGTDTNTRDFLGVSFYVLNKGKTFSKIKDICEDDDVDEDIEKIEGILEGEGNTEQLKAGINRLSVNIKEALLNKSQINVEDLRMINKMANYVKRAAEQDSYYVPTEISGKITTIKITMETGSEEKGKVTIRINGNINADNETDSEIKAEFTINNEEVKGLIMSNKAELELLKDLDKMLEEELRKRGLKLKSLNMTESSYVSAEKKQENQGDRITVDTLLNVAKVYISCVKNCAV